MSPLRMVPMPSGTDYIGDLVSFYVDTVKIGRTSITVVWLFVRKVACTKAGMRFCIKVAELLTYVAIDNNRHKFSKETLINWLYERIASLRGTRTLAYLVDMFRLLRSVRLALHFARRINQRFHNYQKIVSAL